MKTSHLCALFTSTSLLLASTPSAFAQKTLKIDPSGTLTNGSRLDLGSAAVTGTLAPARLGTGTPSSATVLRGDGTWVGTTPTGNTIAATTNLLLGDGVGNAAQVASSADLQRLLQMRADTGRKLSATPANRLNSSNLVIRNGTVNADGTITVPANDYVQWNNAGDTATQALRYCYAVATIDQPVGAAGFYIKAFYNGYNNVGFGGNEVSSAPEPGVSKYTFVNNVGSGAYTVYVVNASSSAIRIYPPVMTLVDAGLLPVQSYADAVPVTSQPVADFDFTAFANGGRYIGEQPTTVAVDSVGGADSNPGTLYSPKRTLQQTVADGTAYGLFRGSSFRESLPFSAVGDTHGLLVQSVAMGAVGLPVISALDPATNSAFVNNGDGTFSYDWVGETTLANDGYQNVYVVEINTDMETALPVAARRRMTDLTSASAVVTAPGSVQVQQQSPGHWTARLRPSDSLSPGSGSYRYEVVARFSPANWGGPNNFGDGTMRGLELVGGSNGYGSIASPINFTGDRLVLLHGTTHGAVLGGGSLQHSVFYEMGDEDSIQLAWYTSHPAGHHWFTRNCLFYANVGDRAANCIISHGSDGSNYDRGDIADTAFIGARWSNGSLHGTAIDYNNVAAGTINHVYVQAINNIFGYSMPLATEVENSVFRQVSGPRVGGSFHDNIVLAESIADPAANANYPRTLFLQQNGASATNNILWAHALTGTTAGANDQVIGTAFAPGVTSGTVQRNIVILDPVNTTLYMAYALFPAGVPAGFAIDYNLVINLAKGGVNTVGGTGNCYGWPEYQAHYPTLDAHSLFVDLSNDPRGLKALFVDPINGDFRWAQTDIASQCAAYCRANNVGPATVTSHWPVVPSVDDALRCMRD